MSQTYQVQSIRNTFRMDVRCYDLVEVTHTSQLPALLKSALSYPSPPLVLGYASNVILPKLYTGMVILNRIMGVDVVLESAEHVDVEVGSGEVWHDFVSYALSQEWYGLENLALIPGGVGAALVQNIGAYGVEICQFVLRCEVYCRRTGLFVWLSARECAFAYRSSIFKNAHKNQYIIVRTVLRLAKTPDLVLNYPRLSNYIKENVSMGTVSPNCVFDAVCAIRRARLPCVTKTGTVGSFFINPVISADHFHQLQNCLAVNVDWFLMDDGRYKLFVGNLLSLLGWRGYRRGQFVVNRVNPIVLEHLGGGEYEDLMWLISAIQQSVWQVFAIKLSPEPEIVCGSN